MKQYYVVRSTIEKDEEVEVIDALSLKEAHAIVKVRLQESMKKGETLYTFPAFEPVEYDENNRIILLSREVMSISKLG